MSLVRQLDPRLKVVDEQRSRRGGRGRRGENHWLEFHKTQIIVRGNLLLQSMLISFSSGGEALLAFQLTFPFPLKDANHRAASITYGEFISSLSNIYFTTSNGQGLKSYSVNCSQQKSMLNQNLPPIIVAGPDRTTDAWTKLWIYSKDKS